MSLPCFGNGLRGRLNTPSHRRFQSTINARSDFGYLFSSQIVRVISEVAVRQTLSD